MICKYCSNFSNENKDIEPSFIVCDNHSPEENRPETCSQWSNIIDLVLDYSKAQRICNTQMKYGNIDYLSSLFNIYVESIIDKPVFHICANKDLNEIIIRDLLNGIDEGSSTYSNLTYNSHTKFGEHFKIKIPYDVKYKYNALDNDVQIYFEYENRKYIINRYNFTFLGDLHLWGTEIKYSAPILTQDEFIKESEISENNEG